jgi:hypothetical protein
LITTPEKVGRETIKIVDKLLENLPTSELAGTSWRNYGEVILVDNVDEAYKLADEFSSEHVQILTEGPREALKKISNYGALFLGEKTCVSYGDKVRSQPINIEADPDLTTVHRYQPHSTNAKDGQLYRRSLGEQVPQDADVPRDCGRKGERRDGQALWAGSVGGVQGPRTLRAMPGLAT